MSDNVVFLQQLKENILDFDITLQGLEQLEMYVYFIIQTEQMTVGFKAEKTGIGDKWSVKIPPVPFLERTSYQFYMCVIANGYYFEPLRGTVTIMGSQEVYVTKPENTTLKSTIVPDNTASAAPTNIVMSIPAMESTPSKKRWSEKSIAELAAEITKDDANESKLPAKKTIIVNESTTSVGNTKDVVVKQILKDIGIVPPLPKSRASRFSLRKAH